MNPLIERAIQKQEGELGAPLDYLRDIASASTAAFVKFGLFAPLSQHRKGLSRDVWHLARLGATRAQDCGTCVQIVVNAARNDGVARGLLQSALADEPLPADPQLALDYGRAVAEDADDVLPFVDAARERFGDDGLAELALAVATAQVFPILKRGLGQAVACSLVHVDVR